MSLPLLWLVVGKESLMPRPGKRRAALGIGFGCRQTYGTRAAGGEDRVAFGEWNLSTPRKEIPRLVSVPP